MTEEAEFLSRLQAGEKLAFQKLITVHQKTVINTCFRFLLNREDAEDIAQEVFIQVYQSIKTFNGQSKLSTWIYRIAVSKSIDEIRRRNRKKRITEAGRLLHLEDIAEWIAGGIMPDTKLRQDESMNAVMNVMNKLPENQRVAFTLSRIEGFSNPEIAEIMNTTLLAVESLIFRAKRKISEELERVLKK